MKEFYVTPANNCGFETAVTLAVEHYCPILVANGKVAKAMRKFIDEYGYVDSVGDEIEVIDAHKAKFPFNRSVVLYQPDEVFEVCFKANVVGSVMTYDEVDDNENGTM